VVIERELGRPMDELFDEFDREPAAAASLGQVHRDVVDGRQVAAKVLRPGVEELVALDLDIGFTLLFWLNILFSMRWKSIAEREITWCPVF
jgi:predicted unusual protein kinase regulating ubiquinone biosynthesis (AarF/ABC1/UbiB family)